jgi:hypothetical protein
MTTVAESTIRVTIVTFGWPNGRSKPRPRVELAVGALLGSVGNRGVTSRREPRVRRGASISCGSPR